jgi:hypothetical protein
MHNSESLKSAVLDYIARSKDKLVKTMMVSSDWIQFSSKNERLSSEIITAVFDRLGFEY